MDVRVAREAPTISSYTDSYFLALGVLLAGYAICGKPFAYLGLAPLYIGEIALIFGLVAFARSRCAIASVASTPSIILLLLFFWASLHLYSSWQLYGFDTLRDSVIVYYGVYAFIIAALLLEKPHRLGLVISFAVALALVIVPIAPVLLLIGDATLNDDTFGVGSMSWTAVKAGTTGVHLTGAALLALLGFFRIRGWWLILLLTGTMIVSTQARGGLLCILIPVSFAAIAAGKWRPLGAAFALVALLISIAYVADLSIPTARTRDISAVQFVDNVASLFGGGKGDLDGTKVWRLNWWHEIFEYTFEGPYFWTGKGFGVNLAISDGITSPTENSLAPLRSPHNGHLTFLARTGVPGLCLWIAALLSWGCSMLWNMLKARRSGLTCWANFFLLIFCYATSFIIDASFDVELEGPMAGIWFWCLFGIGIGAMMIFRAAGELANLSSILGDGKTAECTPR